MKNQIKEKTTKTTNSITKLRNRNFLMTSFLSRYLETIKEVMLGIFCLLIIETGKPPD